MKKIILGTILVIFLGGVAYLLFPLGSSEFEIVHSEQAIAEKRQFLNALSPSTDSAVQPNIIVILADDLGKTDISLYGSKFINTPNIDNIGKRGVIFSEGYSTSPICSPSRASLLTGRYQQRFGMEYQIHERYLKNRLEYYGFKYFVDSDPWHPIYMNAVPRPEDIANQGLPPSEITFAEIAKARGYNTALIGKWHLGYRNDLSPNSFGFDYFYGFKSAAHLYANKNDPGVVNQRIEEDWTDSYIWDCMDLSDCNMYRNDQQVELEGYLTEVFADEAVRFIEENQSNPFLLYLPFNAPHTPLQAPKEYVDKFASVQDPVKRVYLAMIAALDDAVGRITRKLEELNLNKNTLVVFMSDNGGATYAKVTDNAPLRGGKITQFEGGINVPMMMQWDGVIEPGSRFVFPAMSIDIFASIAGILKVEVPLNRIYEGKDLIPYLTKLKGGPPHEVLYWQSGYNKAIRYDQWKLMYNENTKEKLLFNMAADKFEERNFAENQESLANQLLELHSTWSKELPRPLWPGMIEFRYYEGNKWYGFID